MYADESDLLYQLKKLTYEFDMQSSHMRDSKAISTLFSENIKSIEGKSDNNNVIKSGFVNLDKVIGGFSPGELVVIGGRPGMGKTLLLVKLALNISSHYPVQFFTYDLTSFLLTNRFISNLSGIAMSKILQFDFKQEEKAKLTSLEKDLKDHRIFINDSYSNSVTAFKEHCLKQIEELGVKVIFLDYLQMMSTSRYRNSRELEISYITRELKNFAKDNDVCIIVSSQLSRAVETRGWSKQPLLSDLRDSGSIEQDADKVIFIYRPEYYNIMEDEEGNNTDCIVELIIAKNRNGIVETVKLKRDEDFTTFNDFTEYQKDFTFLPDRINEIDKKSF